MMCRKKMAEQVVIILAICNLISSSIMLISTYLEEVISCYSPKYNSLIYPLFFCQIMTSIGGVWGYLPNHHIFCKLQAFLISYFQLCSLFWCSIITILLYRIIYCLPGFNPFVLPVYIICWGFPLLLTLLPLTTLSYGHSYDDNSYCYLKDTNDSSSNTVLLWSWFSFYLFYWCYLFTNLLLFVIILWKLLTVHHLLQSRFFNFSIISRCLLRLVAYPLISILTLFPSALYYTMSLHQQSHHKLKDTGNIFIMMGGLLTSFTFLATHSTVLSLMDSSEQETSQNNTEESNQKSSSYSNRATASIRNTRSGDMSNPITNNRRNTLFEVDDEYIFHGLPSINHEMRKRLSIDDLKILETLRMTNIALNTKLSSSSSPHTSKRYQDSDIDVSVGYRANSLESNDHDSLSENRISLRLRLLKSAIHQIDEERGPDSITPFQGQNPSSNPLTTITQLQSDSELLKDSPITNEDRLSICSL